MNRKIKEREVRHRAKSTARILCVLGLLLGLAWAVQASSPGPSLNWWTVDGGGWIFSSGAGFNLSGTAGQADAGVLTGGAYTLGGGFWQGGKVASPSYRNYLPLMIRIR
jgi:hypothetical protein